MGSDSVVYMLVDSDERFLTTKIRIHHSEVVTTDKNTGYSKWSWEKNKKILRVVNNEDYVLTTNEKNEVIAAAEISDDSLAERQRWAIEPRVDKTCLITQKVGEITYYLTSPLAKDENAYIEAPVAFGEEHFWRAHDAWTWLNPNYKKAE